MLLSIMLTIKGMDFFKYVHTRYCVVRYDIYVGVGGGQKAITCVIIEDNT